MEEVLERVSEEKKAYWMSSKPFCVWYAREDEPVFHQIMMLSPFPTDARNALRA